MDGNVTAKKLSLSIQQSGYLLGASVGSGNQARLFYNSGIDFFLASSFSRMRQMGTSPIAGILPFVNSNEIVMNFSKRELLPGKFQIPVLFGLCATDPGIHLPSYLENLKELGFSGIMNLPSIGMFDGKFREALTESGIDYEKEVEAIQLAHDMGMFTIACVYNHMQALQMRMAGADILLLEGTETMYKMAHLPVVLAKPLYSLKTTALWNREPGITCYIGEKCLENIITNHRNPPNLKEILFVQEPPQENSFPMNGKEDYVNYVKRYINKNYKRKLCLNDIAQEMNLSRSYLSTVFNQLAGCSFQEYISDFRIRKAMELMHCKDIPLYTLAEMVGYEDYAHFSKVFKRKTGICPKHFAG